MSEDTPTYETQGATVPEPGEQVDSPDPAAENRLIETNISVGILGLILSGKWRAVATDAPEDLMVVGASIDRWDRLDGKINLICASKSFDRVPEGGRIPTRHFTYMGTRPGPVTMPAIVPPSMA